MVDDAYPSCMIARSGGGGWWAMRTLCVCLQEVVVVGGGRPGDVAISRGAGSRVGDVALLNLMQVGGG